MASPPALARGDKYPFGSFRSFAFQKPNAQCSLNEAIPKNGPLYSNEGMPHLMVSSTSGQPLCTNSRKYSKIGFAKAADLIMYSSTRGLLFPIKIDFLT